MIKEAISKIVLGEDLSQKEAKQSMDEIMSGNSQPSQIGAFLVALRMKGETVDEITGFAESMREKANRLNIDPEYAIDTCGTGGDGGKTFNISTAVAIIAAAGDVKVAKHGNRASSSRSGSADVLRALDVEIEMDPQMVKTEIENVGFGFLFAQKYHTAMKYVADIRRELGVRTVFNVLGPITNPAFVKGQLLGVYDRNLVHPLAKVLLKLGCERAMVVHGEDGLDEITTTSRTFVSEVKDEKIMDYIIDPHDFGIPYANLGEIAGGDPQINAMIIKEIFEGKKGPKRDIVVLNAAAALYVGKTVKNLKAGISAAKSILDSGLALEKLDQIVKFGKVRL
ncbi:MAG: anthranilate phosphoribosyltransferase [Athalassotoga sp.]|uniref:anthranilate phosphoribosyltransferase n=1 Tax=Athalassotoga sp. TaxID=2022597 RepID=UPI003D06A544